jgi:hypothetical protein
MLASRLSATVQTAWNHRFGKNQAQNVAAFSTDDYRPTFLINLRQVSRVPC